ncbi:MAG TPA: aminotransferase class I/II-fold pyridoxal phosphate-dependent enzyme [Candidatus Acidoferrales bacterium]|nr:aminotransferase class I/II-fold pyridoxal phosphate-dependent enzyme [Candidatus Acidoferrales bacterium]
MLRLGANESAFGTSPKALARMRDELVHTGWYGDPESHELRHAVARRHGCSPENVTVGVGIDDFLGLAVRTFVAPGEAALTAHGSYPTFAFHVCAYGCKLETIAYASTGSIDLEALAVAARRLKPRIVYLANPDNPSGTFAPKDEVARLRDALPAGTLLLLDEAYADFVPPDALLEEEIDPRVVRLRTFSKAYGMAGARLAYALSTVEIAAAFDKIRHHYGVNRNAQIGGLAALEDQEFVSGVVAAVAQGREDYYRLGVRLGLRTLPSSTNFVCFEIGTRAQAEALVSTLLELGVFIRKPGAPPLDGFVRVTVGTPEQRAAFEPLLAEALERIGAKAPV